jgi:hypothetical protein
VHLGLIKLLESSNLIAKLDAEIYKTTPKSLKSLKLKEEFESQKAPSCIKCVDYRIDQVKGFVCYETYLKLFFVPYVSYLYIKKGSYHYQFRGRKFSLRNQNRDGDVRFNTKLKTCN